jgi:pre-mRNA cleavage complex 2 protein Pcf11
VRREGVLAALYWAFPHQCKRCGRRFRERDEYSAHLDWHFQQNKRRRERKTASRAWLAPGTEWGAGPEGTAGGGPDAAEVEGGGRTEGAQQEEETAAVPADEGQTTCALCGEAFEVRAARGGSSQSGRKDESV